MLLPTYTHLIQKGAAGRGGTFWEGVGAHRLLLYIVAMETFVYLEYSTGIRDVLNYIYLLMLTN